MYVHVDVDDVIHILAGQHYLFNLLQYACERWVIPHSHIRIQSGGLPPSSHKVSMQCLSYSRPNCSLMLYHKDWVGVSPDILIITVCKTRSNEPTEIENNAELPQWNQGIKID